MTPSKTFRRFALAGVLTVAAAVCAPAMLAQRGPAPPSGPGGGGNSGGGQGGFGGGIRNPNGPPNIGGGVRRGAALGLPGRWWNDKHFIKQLNLRPDQQVKMDAIFDAHRAALTGSLQNLQQQRAQLNSLSHKDLQDENKVLASIDRVVAARAGLAQETTQVLVALRKELDSQQAEVLDKEIAATRK